MSTSRPRRGDALPDRPADPGGTPGATGVAADGLGPEPVAPEPVAPGPVSREPAFRPASADAPEPWPDPCADGRPAALRIAGLHLRAGMHALARAELESLAARGLLDDGALLDLAGVRWRTGDLAGAGEAAGSLLSRGCDEPLALVIAAEAVAAAGRPGEARRLSAAALEAADGSLDAIFAGMPRATVWPAAESEPPPDVPHWRRRPGADAEGAPSTAAEAFAGGRAALARGDAVRAALLLAVALRLEPGFADDVLHALAGRDDQPLLALVRGDALRLVGREAEALEAFDRARGRSSLARARPEAPPGPGLFDDDAVT